MILGTFLQQFPADQKIIIKNENGQYIESVAGCYNNCLYRMMYANVKDNFLIITLSVIDFIGISR